MLLLDGSVTIGDNRDALHPALARRPHGVILWVSMKTCPTRSTLGDDQLPTLTLQERLVIGFALDWKPWKQFLGRFWCEGLTLRMRYVCPTLRGTVDEARMELNRRKWASLTRFRLAFLRRRKSGRSTRRTMPRRSSVSCAPPRSG